jgi:drug/metabolite transporter (DMT)-like permease
MKTAVVLTVAALSNSLGNLFLSKGMESFRPPGGSAAAWLSGAAGHAVSNPWMIAGIVLLILFLASYLSALSWADLSFVLPATAPAYLLTVMLAAVFLHETISPARWAGTGLIVIGTVLVARSYAPPARQPSDETSETAGLLSAVSSTAEAGERGASR